MSFYGHGHPRPGFVPGRNHENRFASMGISHRPPFNYAQVSGGTTWTGNCCGTTISTWSQFYVPTELVFQQPISWRPNWSPEVYWTPLAIVQADDSYQTESPSETLTPFFPSIQPGKCRSKHKSKKNRSKKRQSKKNPAPKNRYKKEYSRKLKLEINATQTVEGSPNCQLENESIVLQTFKGTGLEGLIQLGNDDQQLARTGNGSEIWSSRRNGGIKRKQSSQDESRRHKRPRHENKKQGENETGRYPSNEDKAGGGRECSSVPAPPQPIPVVQCSTRTGYHWQTGTNSSGPDLMDILRPVIVDGSNVAFAYGNNSRFSCKGIRICVNNLIKLGCKSIHVVVQESRLHRRDSMEDAYILQQLKSEGRLQSWSRFTGHHWTTSYDDRFILEIAAKKWGVVVSNDQFRDLWKENPRWRFVISNRVIGFRFIEGLPNEIFFPQDPYGRHGKPLDRMMRF